MLLTRWIEGEHVRLAPTGAQALIKQSERWDAVTRLALALWCRIEPTMNLTELADEVRKNVMSLFDRSIDPDLVTHQVASGTLLVRDGEGNFGFIHQSILEWLVANDAAKELKAACSSRALTERELSPLMIDFLISLAGKKLLLSWAESKLEKDDWDNAVKKNAVRIMSRLDQKWMKKPIQLSGKCMQGEDLSGKDLSGANLRNTDLSGARLMDTILDGADLSDAVFRDSILIGASLRNADLHNADFGGARMMGADLQESRMEGARLKRAKLIGAYYDFDIIKTADTWGTALTVEDGIYPYNSTSSRIQGVAWHPHESIIAFGNSADVCLYDNITGREIRRLKGHDGTVQSVAFSPDGAMVASGSDDKTVCLWETATGREIRRLKGHDGSVQSVAFSPDGTMVASGSDDNTVRLWIKDSSVCIAVLVHTLEGWVTYLPDGRYKFGGDVGGQFWHAINLCRFEIGELDPYWPTPLRMADDELLFK